MAVDKPIPSFWPSFIGSPDLIEDLADLRKSVLARLVLCHFLLTSFHNFVALLQPVLILLKLTLASSWILVIGCLPNSITVPKRSSAYLAPAFNLSNLSIVNILSVSIKSLIPEIVFPATLMLNNVSKVVVIILTAVWCLSIQSDSNSSAPVNSFNAPTIANPVILANGLRKSSKNHSNTGPAALITLCTTLSDAANRSKKSGSNFVIVNPANGSKTFL